MKLDEIREQLDRNAQIFKVAFSTDAGRKVMKQLDTAYPAGDLFDSDPLKMARKIGAFEVVQGIRELIERGSLNDSNQ